MSVGPIRERFESFRIIDGINIPCPRVPPGLGPRLFRRLMIRAVRTGPPCDAAVPITGGLCIAPAEIQFDARLMGNGRDMKDRIGRATQGHIHGDGVFEGRKGGDIPWFCSLF